MACALFVSPLPFVRYHVQKWNGHGQTSRMFTVHVHAICIHDHLDVQITMALFVIILLVSAMLASVGWLWLAGKIGKFGAWQAMNFVNAATNLSFFLIGKGQSYRVLAAGALNGVPVGAYTCFKFVFLHELPSLVECNFLLSWYRAERSFQNH